jgi:rod shape determining protein RodA
MSTLGSKHLKPDWVIIFLFICLAVIGWINIYSASVSGEEIPFLDFSKPYGKQLGFLGLSSVLILLIFSLDSKFYERFAFVFYLITSLLLIGLFLFGKKISGATSWYVFGGVSIQPSEFAKVSCALLVAKYLSDNQVDLKNLKDLSVLSLWILIPAFLILIQPDAGSALVFSAFFLVMYLHSLSGWFVFAGFSAIIMFLLTLVMGTSWAIGIVFSFCVLLYFLLGKRKHKTGPLLLFFSICVVFSLSVNYIFEEVFEQRHRDRFNIVLGLTEDNRDIGFNTYQSKIALGSGGFWGKGFLEGTQTKGNFVPEQHTDYIFTTVGEEWGFAGSFIVIVLFVLLLLRLLHLINRQKTAFAKWYGYGVVSVFFVHFAINIGMVIGVVPTIGIPLPFFSYGGSSLWGFTLLLFIFIKLDATRYNEW